MKISKACKIFLFIATLFAILTASFMFVGTNYEVYADENVKDYFTATNADLSFDGENLEATVKNGATVSVKNQLAINDILFESVIGSGISDIKIVATYDSYYPNGAALTSDAKLDTEIKSELKIHIGDANLDLTFNNQSGTSVAKALNTEFGFKVADNYVSAVVNGTQIDCADKYYRITGIDKSAASITLSFTLQDGVEEANFKLISIDQKASDASGKYKQTFAYADAETREFVSASPVIALNDNMFTDSSVLKVVSGQKSTFRFKYYSVLGDSYTLYLATADGYEGTQGGNIVLENLNTETPTSVTFNKKSTVVVDDMKINVVSKKDSVSAPTVHATYDVKVYGIDDDVTAPVYDIDSSNAPVDSVAYDNYLKAVQEATKTTYDDGEEYCIRIGDTFTVPSLKTLVSDDFSSFDSLTYTVYYRTPSSTESSTTGSTFTVSEPGEYLFYVVFKDKNNEMDKDDFFTVSDDDENDITYGKYAKFVFRFTIQDDAPFYVNKAEQTEQGKGYVDISYTAKPFEISAYNYSASYSLYYNANIDAQEDDEGWLLVVEGDNFTSDDISDIAYDGSYTFTPTKKGAYKIECNIISSNEVKSASAAAVIKIDGDATVVKPASHWFRDNLASVIFLSAGTVCLILLLVLIFAKPKQPDEASEKKEPKK